MNRKGLKMTTTKATIKTPKQLIRDDLAKQYKKIRRILGIIKVVKQTERDEVKQAGKF